jgi:hypothetical protein
LFIFSFATLGLELRAYTLGHSTSPSPTPFLWVFFEIGFLELFAHDGFKL